MRWILVLVAGCSGGYGASDARQIDSYRVPDVVTLYGRTMEHMTSPVARVTIDGFVLPASTPAATATSAATGEFAVSLPTGNRPIQVRLRAHDSSHVDTYFDYPVPIDADHAQIILDMWTPTSYAGAYSSTGVVHQSGTAVLELEATDPFGGAASDVVMISESGGTVVYTTNGMLDANATRTDNDGRAYVLDAPASDDVIIASGGSFPFSGASDMAGVADAVVMGTIQGGFGGE